MISLRFSELAAVIGGTLYNSDNAGKVFSGVSIDSRTVKPGQLFIAIRGASRDGHDYIEQAVGQGAVGVVSELNYPYLTAIRGDVAVVAVADSHRAMIALARRYRDSLEARFIGITGSNGKTTTKELTYQLLKAVEPHSYRSPGNFNNLYGVPLALLAVKKDARAVVLEMGISTTNEMPQLAEIVHPDLIIITNVGPSHLEFLDTVADVAKAKLELVKKAASSVPVIINGDNAVLVEETKKVRDRFTTFALDAEADFKPQSISRDDYGVSIVTIEGHAFRLPLIGRHQVYNLLAAYAAARTLGYSFDNVDTMNIPLETAPMRGQTLVQRDITIVADCYNANPDSVKAGLAAYAETVRQGRRVIILGDMLELGANGEKYHREIGRIVATVGFDLLAVVGPMSRYIADEAVIAGKSRDKIMRFKTSEEAAPVLAEWLKPGDYVYIKGSRGVALEKILKAIGNDGTEGQG